MSPGCDSVLVSLSCWKRVFEQPPPSQGHGLQMAQRPFGCIEAWARWIQVATAEVSSPASALPEAAFVRGSKGSPDLRSQGDFPPLTIKIQ